ncbi:hypothetical protein CMI37_32425 [Candidatus Pacearchaeota archaeon]|nr:hypothetical protein [Candidatus Pacearchaeota archaeon]|tara:strand:- start:2085 stop:2861 length:777 start_codon:yes stop_codon:yes gene_type:complete
MTTETVTYNTICWEKDWKELLLDGVLERNIQLNDHPFTNKTLWINNVNDHHQVEDAAMKLVEEGVLTHVYNIKDHVEDSMEHFKLTREADSLGSAYNYSVGSLCGIYACTTDWFLNYTGDAILTERAKDWIPNIISYMAKDSNYKVGNLLWSQWDKRKNRARLGQVDLDRTSEYQDDDWAVGYGFSDQCFLAETKTLMELDYNTRHHLADLRFGRHRTARGRKGSEAGFEKRVEAWKLNNGYKRVTYKSGYYVHDPPF